MAQQQAPQMAAVEQKAAEAEMQAVNKHNNNPIHSKTMAEHVNERDSC